MWTCSVRRLAGDERERRRRRSTNCTWSGLVVGELDAANGPIVCRSALRGGDVGGAQPQVVDRAGLEVVVARRDRLDAVAVGVAQEAAVVVRAVLRARAGGAVVLVAGLVPASWNASTSSVVGHVERDVQVLRERLAVGDRRTGPTRRTPRRVGLLLADRGEDRGVEALRGLEVGDADVTWSITRPIVRYPREDEVDQQVEVGRGDPLGEVLGHPAGA